MNLTSPCGTTSRLTHYRRLDNARDATYLTNWTILTLHHWGENPSGVWKLTLKNSQLKYNNTGYEIFNLFLDLDIIASVFVYHNYLFRLLLPLKHLQI